MRGWRASRAKGSLMRCAAKFVRTASEPFSRTLKAARLLYRSGTASVSTLVSSGEKWPGKNR
ncbi:hypothetical protein D3C72_2076940 [compost metagenome]